MLQKPLKEHAASNSSRSDEAQDDYYNMIDLFYGNWIWRAVHAIIDHPRFNPSPSWIADALSISVQEAVDALDGLEDLGLIRRTESSFIARTPQFLLPKEKACKEYTIKKHRQIASQLTNMGTPKDVEGALVYFLAVDRTHLSEILQKIFHDFQTLDQQVNRSASSQLYAINLTCTNLAPKIKGK